MQHPEFITESSPSSSSSPASSSSSSSPLRKPITRYRSTNQLNQHQHHVQNDDGSYNHTKSYEKKSLVRHRSTDHLQLYNVHSNTSSSSSTSNNNALQKQSYDDTIMMSMLVNNNNKEKTLNDSLSQLLAPLHSSSISIMNNNSSITTLSASPSSLSLSSYKQQSNASKKGSNSSNAYSVLIVVAIFVCFQIRVVYNYNIQRSLIGIYQNANNENMMYNNKDSIPTDASHPRSSSSISASNSINNLNPKLYEKEYTSNNMKDVIIDIISIGSITKKEYQDAQERTFASHGQVRDFYRITEHNDTDTTCSTSLTIQQVAQIKQYCKSSVRNRDMKLSEENKLLRKLNYYPKNHTGWMCAQKRPIDGLYSVLQQYQNNIISIPNFLFLIDDDTYINMIPLVHTLQQNHSILQQPEHTDTTTTDSSKTIPQLLTGCRYNYPPQIHFLFPYGGFGTILSHHTIQHLITPLYCNTYNNYDVSSSSTATKTTTRSGFVQAACWRIQQNLMGEQPYFVEGMSIIELMYTHSKQNAYTDINNWSSSTKSSNIGYCFHSDHALGYYFGYYHIAVPDDQFIIPSSSLQHDLQYEKDDGTIGSYDNYYEKLRYEYGYIGLAGDNECKNVRKRCTNSKSRICHYIQPEQMDDLFQNK